MALEKDKSEDFIISKSLDRIVNLKKRIDRLVFLYIFVCVFGIANFIDFAEIKILGALIISDNAMYHVGIVLVLTTLFGLIGSHLIEYTVKRDELDDRLIETKTFEESKEFDISKTIIPSSIYEYMYTLVIYERERKDWLREISVGVLFVCFFVGHGLSITHLILPFMHWGYGLGISIIILSLLIALYNEFLKSVTRARENLGKRLRKLTFVLGLVCLIIYIGIEVKIVLVYW